MSNPIVMPQLGLTMTEGKLSCWLKNPGDLVSKNEPLLTVETDKAEMEVESLVEGTLGEILVEAGNVVPVGTVLAYVIGDPAQMTAPEEPQAVPPEQAMGEMAADAPKAPVERVAARGKESRQALASPRAKRLARELGIDIGTVTGTGARSEILEDDVRRAAAKQPTGSLPAGQAQSARRRLIIAERLIESIRTIPTFSLTAEANAEKLLALHKDLKASASADGRKLTITDLLLAIFAKTLRAHQDINSVWHDNGPSPQASVNVGLAVATPEGVVAPVLKDLSSLSLAGLVSKRAELTERARAGKLSLPDLEGGTTTLSNLGMFRVDKFDALIAPGQSSILAVGAIRTRPWVADDVLTLKPTVTFTLTVDHRVADGATAAAFFSSLIQAVENPENAWRSATATAPPSSSRGIDV